MFCRKTTALSDEHLVPNPVYDSFNGAPEQSVTDHLQFMAGSIGAPEKSVADNPQYGSMTGPISAPEQSAADNPQCGTVYEMINEFPTKKSTGTINETDQGEKQIYYNLVAKDDVLVPVTEKENHEMTPPMKIHELPSQSMPHVDSSLSFDAYSTLKH